MDIYKIVLIGIIATVVIVLIKDLKSELSVVIALAAGVIMLIMILTALSDVVSAFYQIADKSGVSDGLFFSLLKIIGIGYITEFAANICEDAGSKSISGKILLGGKVAIMVVALPIVQALIDIIVSIL